MTTPVMEAEAVAWLAAYGRAWRQGDVEAIDTLFTEEAVYCETPFDPPMAGRAAIRVYWLEGAAEGQRDVEFSSTLWAVAGPVAIAHWRARFSRVTTGQAISLDGVFRLTFVRGSDGALFCSELREWWHRA